MNWRAGEVAPPTHGLDRQLHHYDSALWPGLGIMSGHSPAARDSAHRSLVSAVTWSSDLARGVGGHSVKVEAQLLHDATRSNVGGLEDAHDPV